MAARKSLLDSEGEDDDPTPTLTINEAFAKRLEHNKKREDLHRLQELQKRGLVRDSDSDDSEDDEDDDGLLPPRTEVRIFDTLNKIRNKDPSIYKSDVKFFDEDEEEEFSDEEDDSKKQRKRNKPVFLKDVVAQQALAGNAEDDDEAPVKVKTYVEEQEDLKNELLRGIAAADEEEEEEEALFKVRKKSEEPGEEGDEQDAEISRRLDEYFGGKDKELDENDKFLKDYLLNQGWIDKDKDKRPSYEDIVGEVSDEEEQLDDQDDYEARYNFRFEEGAGSQVLGHSRVVEDSVRKLPEKRKEQRKKKQARLVETDTAMQEEVKRLKNVKKKEILDRMAKIQMIAGVTSLENLDEADLQADFDPAEHDKKMLEVFGEEYYNEDDPDANFRSDGEDDDEELTKPDFDAEDEALAKQGFAAVHDKLKVVETGETELLKEEIEKKLEEYYKLDYEDIVGGMPTRFKYTQVKPNRFGLTAAQILEAEDSELNQHVSLKALAPYRTEEWLPRHKYHRLTKKERKARALDEVPSLKSSKNQKREDHPSEKSAEAGAATGNEEENADAAAATGNEKKKKTKKKKKKKNADAAGAETGNDQLESQQQPEVEEQVGEQTADASEKSKKKRKRKKQGLNMSQNRLLSYGKIDLPKKKKRKH